MNKIQKRILIITSIIIIGQTALSQQQICTTDSIKSWLYFLASDEMKGRANGSEEIESVAMWLSDKYKEYGLQTFDGLDNFTQTYLIDNFDKFKQSGLLCGDATFVHKNVIGYIPAKEEKNNNDLFVVLSAHFDHLGTHSRFALNGDSIFNGANDNASGVVAMLAIAKNLHEHNIKPDFPIVFAAFSNEELGGLGSSVFIRSGVVPIQKIKVNINLEMLGRTDEYGKNTFYISGPNFSNLQDVVVDFNKNTNWTIAETGDVADMVFKVTDNISFVNYASEVGICVPAHSFFVSGVKSSDMHRPNDEVEFIDFENLYNVVAHFTKLIIHLASKNVEVKCN